VSTPPPSPYQPPQQPHQGGYGQQQPQGQQVPPPPPAYPQGGQQWNYDPGVPQGVQPESPKNFFAALFDWKFRTLITPRIVSWVYLGFMILSGLYWLFLLFGAFAADPVFGVIVLLIGPIVWLITLAFFRMTMELYFALVRMSDDIHRSQGTPPRS